MRRAPVIVAAGLAAFITVTTAAAAPPAPSPCAHVDTLPSAATLAQTRTAIHCLLDAERTAHGRDPLRDDPHLTDAAQDYAEDLHPGVPLDHISPDGSGPGRRIATSGYAGGQTSRFDYAEALGRALGRAATPRRRVSEWMADASTRRLLMAKRFRDVGLGVAVDGPSVSFVVDLAYPLAGSSPAKRRASDSSKRDSGSSRRSPKRSRS